MHGSLSCPALRQVEQALNQLPGSGQNAPAFGRNVLVQAGTP